MTVADAGLARGAAAARAWWRRSGPPWLVLACYLIVSFSGITTSSLGISFHTQSGARTAAGTWGQPRWIRSDEYNADTPIDLSILATGGAPTLSPLGADAGLVHRYVSGPVSALVFPDALLLRLPFLPDQVAFAARWWFPFLVLFLALPSWFASLGAARRWGYVAAGVISVSPAVAWWSAFPVRAMAYTAGASALLLLAFASLQSGRRVWAAAQGLAGGILLAGFPAFYVPWAFVLGLPLLLASVAWVATRTATPWRTRLAALSAVGVPGLVLAVGLLLEFRESVTALLGTVYPGSRRSTPHREPVSQVYGAPALGPLQDGVEPQILNASELATGYTVALVVLAVLAVGRRRWDVALTVLVASSAVWLAWCSVTLASLPIPVLSSVPPERSAQVVGILGTVALCLFLGKQDTLRLPSLAAACGLAAVVTAYAAYVLRSRAFGVESVGAAIAIALVTAIAVALLVLGQRWAPALLGVVALAALPTWHVNPIMAGLGDLRGSESAHALAAYGAEARSAGTVWVSEAPGFNPLLLANGVPALSGLQRSGPDAELWARIDPTGEFEEAWNRGGGYVDVALTPGEATVVETDGFDQTYLRIDPCVLAEEFPELDVVLSTQDRSGIACLTPFDTVTWNGQRATLYRVGGTSD